MVIRYFFIILDQYYELIKRRPFFNKLYTYTVILFPKWFSDTVLVHEDFFSFSFEINFNSYLTLMCNLTLKAEEKDMY